VKILRYKTIDGREFCFVANAVERITDTPDGPRVKLKWDRFARLLDEVTTAEVARDVKQSMIDKPDEVQLKITVMINKGYAKHRDLFCSMRSSASPDEFRTAVDHLVKSGTILAHKEGRGTVYSLK
jgi:hypothetical protein